MKNRVDLAHQKGCDAVDVDNVDGYVSVCFFFFLNFHHLFQLLGTGWMECDGVRCGVVMRPAGELREIGNCGRADNGSAAGQTQLHIRSTNLASHDNS